MAQALGNPGAATGASGVQVSRGPTSRPSLPHSPAPRCLRPSCPPAPPRRPSHHSRCPRCGSAPPSPTAGEARPRSVPFCPAPLPASLWDLGSRATPIRAGSSPCQVNSVTEGAGLQAATVSPAHRTGCGVRVGKQTLTDCLHPRTHVPGSTRFCLTSF